MFTLCTCTVYVSYKQVMASIVDPVALATRKLGYQNIKDHQLEVVSGIIKGHDVFALLPTGYGKSLCFAILPMVYDQILTLNKPSIVIVISLLTAIMEDQVSERILPLEIYN